MTAIATVLDQALGDIGTAIGLSAISARRMTRRLRMAALNSQFGEFGQSLTGPTAAETAAETSALGLFGIAPTAPTASRLVRSQASLMHQYLKKQRQVMLWRR